jgi:MoxR-like ATPase
LRDRARVEVSKVVVGHDGAVDLLLVAALAHGHVLIEGPPGSAKTLLARSMAHVLGAQFKRIQFTPDLSPEEITGQNVTKGGEPVFKRGVVFTNVLLADEINRTPPRTQAALLEAMQERTVTVDGRTHQLPDPFLVIATQNPYEHEGDLPAARVAAGPLPLQGRSRLRGPGERAGDAPAPAHGRHARHARRDPSLLGSSASTVRNLDYLVPASRALHRRSSGTRAETGARARASSRAAIHFQRLEGTGALNGATSSLDRRRRAMAPRAHAPPDRREVRRRGRRARARRRLR